MVFLTNCAIIRNLIDNRNFLHWNVSGFVSASIVNVATFGFFQMFTKAVYQSLEFEIAYNLNYRLKTTTEKGRLVYE